MEANTMLAEKSARLEAAAAELSPEEISRVFKELGTLEYTARALGIACRYRGVECVRALVEGGASFHAELTNYAVQTYGSYGDDLCVMLLEKLPEKTIPYIVIAPKLVREPPKTSGGKALSPISFEKRLEVIDYLTENSEKAEFDPGELLYYSVLFGDKKMYDELKKRGAMFSEYRKNMLTNKSERKDLYIWSGALERLSEKDFSSVLRLIFEEVGGEKLHCTEGIFFACDDNLFTKENLTAYFEVFDKPYVRKGLLLEWAVDRNRVECLEFAAENGWLKQPKKRDELIEYAQKIGNTECTAWLLDLKNRTADLKAEREKSEKRQTALLNAAPYSVTAMKELWSWKKHEGGGIMVTNYKGKSTEITVPEKIGKDAVTAMGMAFSPAARGTTKEISDFRETIKSVTLPETITEIYDDAFRVCLELEFVNIPKAVTKIGKGAFVCCRRLSKAEIPEGVEEIADYTFEHCDSLRSVELPDSVKRIGINAFWDCGALEKINIPADVTEIGTSAFAKCESLRSFEIPSALEEIPAHILEGCIGLESVVIPRGITVISQQAFMDCGNLAKLDIPDTVRKIGDHAFARCELLETVVVPEGVTEIGGRVFGDCRSLKRVELPSSLKKIVNFNPKGGKPITIFDGSPNVTAIVCPKSYAEKYCKRNNIPYEYKEQI